MKKFFTCLAVIATMAGITQLASADAIFEFTTTEGVSEGDLNVTGNANLTSFSTADFVYTGLTGIGNANTTNPALLFANTLSVPASADAALSDLNLATGTLNTGNLDSGNRYDISSATVQSQLAAGATFFVFGNGNGGVSDPIAGSGGTTPPNVLSFFDSSGAVIGTLAQDYFFQDPGTNSVRAPNLATFDFERDPSNPLNNRTISGATFEVSDIVFTSGSIADAVSFGTQSNSFDAQDFGIAAVATAAVPEPSSAIILVGGLGAFLVRRRRK